MCVPILSHNGTTTNVLLQITVPKRTGRKRKRGSQDPYLEPSVAASENEEPAIGPGEQDLPTQGEEVPTSNGHNIASHSRRDDPVLLRRIMRDNVGKYTFEPVAKINHTHRFRGKSLRHHYYI